jgi:hypothetical protein
MQLNKDEIQKSKLVVALWDADLLSQDDFMSGVSMQSDISVLNVIGLRLIAETQVKLVGQISYWMKPSLKIPHFT